MSRAPTHARAQRVEATLAAAGIAPGHPSLYPAVGPAAMTELVVLGCMAAIVGAVASAWSP